HGAVRTRYANIGELTAKGSLPSLNSEVMSVRARDLTVIADDADVEFVWPDRIVRSSSFSGSPDYAWIATGAKTANTNFGLDGAGIGVAILDSGVAEHPDLNSKVRYAANFVPAETDTRDGYGHGTHVAGIIAGNGRASSAFGDTYIARGIAPGANLIVFRVLDSAGVGSDSAVIRAIEQAIDLKDRYNIRVMNLSIGRPVAESYRTDPLCRAIENAWRAGIVVVTAAGNEGRNNEFGTDGYGTITAPGNDTLVITVGAMNTVGTETRSDDKIASYSSKGPTSVDHVVKPDLVAPGNQIISLSAKASLLERTYPENLVPMSLINPAGSGGSSEYIQLSGTSMAAPMVCGVVALLVLKEL